MYISTSKTTLIRLYVQSKIDKFLIDPMKFDLDWL